MFGTMKLTYGPQKRSRGALKNTNIRSPWVRTAPKPQRIRRPGWPGPTRPPKPPPPLRQPPSPMLFVQLTPCCILFPPWEALRHSWVYSLLQREVLSGINVATPYGTNLWAFTHWFIWHVSFDTLINEASEAQQPDVSYFREFRYFSIASFTWLGISCIIQCDTPSKYSSWKSSIYFLPPLAVSMCWGPIQ